MLKWALAAHAEFLSLKLKPTCPLAEISRLGKCSARLYEGVVSTSGVWSRHYRSGRVMRGRDSVGLEFYAPRARNAWPVRRPEAPIRAWQSAPDTVDSRSQLDMGA